MKKRLVSSFGGTLCLAAAIIVFTCAAKRNQGCAEISSDLLYVNQSMPSQVQIGGNFQATIQIGATKCAANVVVGARVPNGASYVRSEPAAMVNGPELVWQLGDLDPGQTVTIVVFYKADKEGTLAADVWASADPRLTTAVLVVN